MKTPLVSLAVLLVSVLFACSTGPTPPEPTPDFQASLTPATASLTQGQQATVTVKLTRTDGFAGAVSLSLPNPPAGIAATALSIPVGSDSAVLTLSTDATATVGVHNLELSAVSGSLTHPVKLELTVTDANTPDFALAITPSSLALKQGVTGALDVTLNRLNGFMGDVTVTLGSPPLGLTAATLVIPAGSSSGTLNVTAAANAATGSGSLTVQGTSGAFSHSVSLPWTILNAVNPDFALNVTTGLSVIQGSSDGVTINVDRQNGFSGIVDVTLVNPPAGIDTVALQIPAGANSGFLGIGVQAQVPVGTVSLNISGASGGLTRTLIVPLTIVAAPDMTAPTLVSSSPVNNATGVGGSQANIVLNFSEPMNPNSVDFALTPVVPGLSIYHWTNNNTTLSASILASIPGQASNGYSSNTTYTLSNLIGEDVSGNALTGTNSFSFTTGTFADTTAPTVLDTIPAAGAQGVAPGLGKTFTATFSEKMSSSALTAVNFVPNAGATNCVFTDSSNTTVQCTPSNGLVASQFYIMTITTAAKDVAGNLLAQLNAISFNTGPTPDTTSPSILTRLPANGVNAIDPNTSIQVNFSEAMNKVATQAAFNLLTPALASGETLNFFWNATATTMFVKRGVAFAYGAAVTWNVAPSAKDMSGNLLHNSSGALQGFTTIRQGKFKLYSDGTLDGYARQSGLGPSVYNNSVTMSLGLNSNPQQGNGWYYRAFTTFDLLKLPNLTAITKIQAASLHVYQDHVICNGVQYVPQYLGNVLAENISYPLLNLVVFGSFFDTPAITVGASKVLSTDATIGYKIMDTTQQIAFDVQNRANLLSRSQWRLRFTGDALNNSQNCGEVAWAGGGAVQSKKPYLDITYLYP